MKNLVQLQEISFITTMQSRAPGFSRIFVDNSLGPGKVVSYVYARLRDSTPLIKIELLGSGHNENEIKLLLDR